MPMNRIEPLRQAAMAATALARVRAATWARGLVTTLTITLTITLTVTLTVTLFTPGAALAHGNDPHARPPAALKREQKDWGIAGEAKAVTRTIHIGMSDQMRFTPDRIQVRQGETLKLVLRNRGKVMHEFVIGTRKDNDEHAALMLKFPAMEHDEPHMVHVAPGQTGAIVWTFNKPGEFDFACLIAGHYQAGMIGKIVVAPR